MSTTFSESLAAFALTALIIEITPGPNMGYLAVLSLSRGWRVGVAAVVGVALGHAAYGLAAALGVATLIEASPLLYEVLRWAGVAYMLWLAYETWATSGETSPDVTKDHVSHARLAFERGLITNLLNPKAAIFFVIISPSFCSRDGCSRAWQAPRGGARSGAYLHSYWQSSRCGLRYRPRAKARLFPPHDQYPQ
jgi:threonine/homoserine/homoserine lactone efflux protein